MRRLYATPIKTYCDSKVEDIIPDFRRVQKARLPAGEAAARAYEFPVNGALWLYLFLEFFKYDKFGFAVGWNTTDQLPRYEPTKIITFKSIPESGQFVGPLSHLYRNGHEQYEPYPSLREVRRGPDDKMDRDDLSRHLHHEFAPEEYMPRITAGVDDGMRKFVQYGIPYLEQIARHFGVPVDIRVYPDASFRKIG